MHVLVLYNAPGDVPTSDELDVLVQRNTVVSAMQALGYHIEQLSCDLNLQKVQDEIVLRQPDVVFNLVEALAGTDRLAPAMTLLLESLGIPFTGSGSMAIQVSANKLTAKRRMISAHLPTPTWWEIDDQGRLVEYGESTSRQAQNKTVIVKAIWEHASFELNDDAVIECDLPAIRQVLERKQLETGRPFFAEAYIDGREFNLSLLADARQVQVLPHAEIQFVDYPKDKPCIVGYEAKWAEGSFEFVNTPRRFQYPALDQPLLDRLADLAIECWHAFDLRGYARVDFRVDRFGNPWILEVNTNPCLSPDAGFAAACVEAKMSMAEAVQRIASAALV